MEATRLSFMGGIENPSELSSRANNDMGSKVVVGKGGKEAYICGGEKTRKVAQYCINDQVLSL